MVSQSKFSVTLPRVWIYLRNLIKQLFHWVYLSPIVTIYHIVKNGLRRIWVYLSPEGVVLNPEGFVLSPEGDVLNPEGFVLPHFWDYLPPERSCFAPRWELKNAIWTVLVLCTKHDDAIEHLSPSKPHKALQNRKIPL